MNVGRDEPQPDHRVRVRYLVNWAVAAQNGLTFLAHGGTGPDGLPASVGRLDRASVRPLICAAIIGALNGRGPSRDEIARAFAERLADLDRIRRTPRTQPRIGIGSGLRDFPWSKAQLHERLLLAAVVDATRLRVLRDEEDA